MIEDVNFQICNQGDSLLGLLSDIGVKECVNFWFCNKWNLKHIPYLSQRKKDEQASSFEIRLEKIHTQKKSRWNQFAQIRKEGVN
jgi:hypothetical protein